MVLKHFYAFAGHMSHGGDRDSCVLRVCSLLPEPKKEIHYICRAVVIYEHASHNCFFICRRGGCAHTRSLRSTGRVRSTSWPPWLGREISTCLKSDAQKGDCQRKTNCTVTQISQVGVLHAALHDKTQFICTDT